MIGTNDVEDIFKVKQIPDGSLIGTNDVEDIFKVKQFPDGSLRLLRGANDDKIYCQNIPFYNQLKIGDC